MSGAVFGGDEVNAIVVDVGTYRTKAGYAGEDMPKVMFPTVAGTRAASASSSMDTSSDESPSYVFGMDTITKPVAGRELVTPFKDGEVADWDLYEALLEHSFQKLHCNPAERPVMLVEPVWSTKAERERVAELLFEKFKVPALYLGRAPVLSSFAAGRGTALVVDSGASFTTAVPVYDGAVLFTGTRRNRYAGSWLTSQYRTWLEETQKADLIPANMVASKTPVVEDEPAVWEKRKNYPAVTHSYMNFMKNDIVRDFIVSVAKVHERIYDEQMLSNLPTTPYEFPNGYNSNYGLERYKFPESLFYPTVLGGGTAAPSSASASAPASASSGTGLTVKITPGVGTAPVASARSPSGQSRIKDLDEGVQSLIANAISACDVDIQQSLWSNIVICGGNTLLQGYSERLSNELMRITPIGTKYKLLSPPTAHEKEFSAWVGGSIFASLGSFQQLWVSQSEYQETGKGILDKRCP